MRYLVCNGSPRGDNGFTSVLIRRFLAGLREAGAEADLLLLDHPARHAEAAAQLAKADVAVVFFPLYTDAMPGILMSFIEHLEPYAGGLSGLSLGFVVHSGFPEAVHCRAVERYLARLAALLGANYAGTAVLGGNPWTKKRLDAVQGLGRRFVPAGHRFDPALLAQAAFRERFHTSGLLLLRPLAALGVFNRYFNGQLKANGVFGRRFDRPYAPDATGKPEDR
ncbi:MAG: NAD(P)H-dependent oxidoreductase [Clostridiaceae bacterium]|nr:NAD(P)H-dependent oxidoreductase [Clostridiaceae bacterium]